MGHNARLNDLSVEARANSYQDLAETYAIFSSYDTSGMNQTERTSYAVFDYFLQQQMAGERWQHHGYPVNQLFGVQNTLPSFFVNMHNVNDATDAEHYVARLYAVNDQFSGLIDDIQQRAERGIRPPKFVLTASMEQIENFLAGGPAENLLLTSLADKLADTQLTEAERNNWLQQAETALTEAVFPAYQNLYASLEQLQAQADNTAGVWKLPDGEAYYNHMLKQHTTTDLTADQIHQLGLAEVDRIQADMQAIFSDVGYNSGSVGELLAQINAQSEFLYPDTDEGRQQILADYKTIITDIKTYLGPAFRVRPQAELDVRRVPEFAQKMHRAPITSGQRWTPHGRACFLPICITLTTPPPLV